MSDTELGSINNWIAVIAIVSVVQLLALATITILGYRLYMNARKAITEMEQKHVLPLTRRVHSVLDEVNDGVQRLHKVGDGVQATWEGIHTGVSTATSAVKSVAWPGWAAVRGVMAAVSAFRHGDERRQARIAERNALTLYEDSSIVDERGNDNEAVRH
jgi:phage-related protein